MLIIRIHTIMLHNLCIIWFMFFLQFKCIILLLVIMRATQGILYIYLLYYIYKWPIWLEYIARNTFSSLLRKHAVVDSEPWVIYTYIYTYITGTYNQQYTIRALHMFGSGGVEWNRRKSSFYVAGRPVFYLKDNILCAIVCIYTYMHICGMHMHTLYLIYSHVCRFSIRFSYNFIFML